MQCNCGDQTKSSVWIVTTKAKISEWLRYESESPVKVYSETCKGCGRLSVKLFCPESGNLILSR